jgi:redox-sensitive bicupin YhaK (pirin superfamily)
MNAMPDPTPLVIEPRLRSIGNLDVRRILPSRQRRSVGPFVFLDHMGPASLAPGTGLDVPPHPHIGLATVTYLFDGALTHRDSLGFEQVIRPGDVNWMTAGGGIVHSERTPPEDRSRAATIDGIQSWVALPCAEEERAASFHHHPAASLPEIRDAGMVLKLIAGEAFGMNAPARVFSRMFYADAACRPGAVLALPPDLGERGVYVAEGRISVAHRTYGKERMLVFEGGRNVTIRAETEARLMVLGGAPLDAPRHMWWNFVSNSTDRIERAKRDWSHGRFAPVPGETDFVPLPEAGG